ncbi:MAG: hypothetical protein R3F43_23385 [bacterium]
MVCDAEPACPAGSEQVADCPDNGQRCDYVTLCEHTIACLYPCGVDADCPAGTAPVAACDDPRSPAGRDLRRGARLPGLRLPDRDAAGAAGIDGDPGCFVECCGEAHRHRGPGLRWPAHLPRTGLPVMDCLPGDARCHYEAACGEILACLDPDCADGEGPGCPAGTVEVPACTDEVPCETFTACGAQLSCQTRR